MYVCIYIYIYRNFDWEGADFGAAAPLLRDASYYMK